MKSTDLQKFFLDKNHISIMKKINYWAIFYFILYAYPAHAQETTYRYEGANYSSVAFVAPCPSGLNCQQYNRSMRVTGTVTLIQPLPPNVTSYDATSLITRFSFNDGINIYSSTDPGAGINNFTVTTNSSGQIKTDSTDFYFLAYRFLDGNAQVNVGERLSVIQIGAAQTTNGLLQDSLNNGECDIVSINGICSSVFVNPQGSSYASVYDGGSWTMVSASAIPTLGEWTMIFMASLMAVVGIPRIRRR